MALLDETRVRPRPREERWPAASDDALVRGAAQGSDGAFDEIFARYQAPLVRYCRGILLDEHLAQDAAQNALTSALRALRGGPAPRALGPWLYRIAQREAFDLARRRRQDAAARRHDGEDALVQVAAPSDERTRERLRELVGDLARLPLRQRSALLLRELSGLGYADIAVALETTPAAARQSVLEARTALVDVGAGRQDSCADVRALIDSGDRRRLRGRRTQAHLGDCAPCSAFARRIEDRRRDLALLFPLPAALAGGGGALAALTGGSVAAGGAGVAAGGWSLGLGGAGAAKCVIACTAAVVGVGAIGERVVGPPHRSAPEVRVVAQAPQPAAPARAAASATAAPTPAVAVRSSASRRAKTAAKPATGSRRTRPRPRPQVASRVPVSTQGGIERTVEKSTGSSGAQATTVDDAPAVPATSTAAPAPAAAPATTPTASAPSAPAASKTQVASAAELQQRITAAATAVTDRARETITQTLAGTARTLDAVNATVKQVTTSALSGAQAQLAALKRLLQPGDQVQP